MSVLHDLRPYLLPIDSINAILPSKGLIYELGCGSGTLVYSLAKNYPERCLVGVDLNGIKIQYAKQQYNLNNVKFIQKDVVNMNIQKCEAVICSDFLHHISFSKQVLLLKKISKKIQVGGRLIIKEIIKNDGVRTVLSRLWDFLLYPNDVIYYRYKTEWIDLLSSFKFDVEVTRKVKWFPGSTILFICTKKI